jgi:predicted metalloprotease
VLFRGAVESACGRAGSAVGPFYCAGDRRVYLDRSFFEDLARRFGAPGEFARAYVIAHEIGHHVQNQMGIMEKLAQQRARAGEARSNALSVKLELQADCFAGIWGHFARQRKLLEPGDVESGLAAAAAIGDDRIQRQVRGHVSPESFTHGSSAQRVHWFRTGLDSGDVRQCNTFVAARPQG